MCDQELYSILFYGVADDCGAMLYFYCRAGHMGEAIARADDYVRSEPATMAQAWAACGDIEDDDEIPEGFDEVGAGLFSSRELHCFPLDDLPEFRFPMGVIPSQQVDEDSIDPGELREGYFIDVDEEDGTEQLNMIVSGERVFSLFLDCVSRLEASQPQILLRLDYDSDGEKIVIYLNESLRGPALLSFLDENADSILRNGLIELCLLLGEQRGTLWLSDHKVIQVGGQGAVDPAALRFAQESGLELLDERICIDSQMNHYHYRPAESMGRVAFERHLLDAGFVEVERKPPAPGCYGADEEG